MSRRARSFEGCGHGRRWCGGRGDRDGKVVLQVTGTPGTSQTVTGKAPFDLTLCSAGENSITWRGAPFDLAPHLRQNVARVRLP